MTLIPPVDPSSSVLLDAEPHRDPVVEAPRVGAAVDPITRLAEALARGEITGDEAVERILEDVLSDEFLLGAPPQLAAEVREVLTAMVETSPHLSSLAASLGARGAG